MTVLVAARVVTGEHVHTPGWIDHETGVIVGVGSGQPAHVDQDLGSAIVVPGFVDTHCHGGGGGSFTDGDPTSAVRAVVAHRQLGTTSIMASLVTAAPSTLLGQVSMLADLVEEGVVSGVHLEGPWLSQARAGAHDRDLLRDPDPEEIDRILAAGRGAVRMVTLAPELPGALDAVRRLVDAGVVVAVGHTDASYDTTVAAIGAGARVGTHLFNAMRPVRHRDPGPVVALLEDPRVVVEVIADEVHLHPALVTLVDAAAGRDRVSLVTDAIAAAGLGDGDYRLGPLQVSVVGGVAHVAGTTTIAGSTTTMDRLFHAAASAGSLSPSVAPGAESDAALLRAVQKTSTTPARAHRLKGGSIEVGAPADLVFFDQHLQVSGVLRCGQLVSGP